ncbi:hypothetical protein JCGZ_09325 [Jatropha curcas]|uniref:non-specific serine/threonine protein kinase n=1 Tax=Jatropha curcas TaxID=180498 RepID=A0A067KFX2_JATCU|nr:LEAF RUST 10 DISEASE-RESISTANCE LOCUS RECEPTOR-LIKE PROTEIN KINASE-like 2.1 [Jatropha curcas]KDP35037.1 hypothetical protein JCGZ_09325 [Jatropha curcas]
MKLNFLLKPFSPLINLFIIISFLLARKVLCIDPYFLACNPKTCGDGQNITFPFFIEDQQESFCGYPGFNLSCQNGHPILNLQDNNYIIQEINYRNQSLRVSNAAIFNTSNTCDPSSSFSFKNMTLSDDRFSLSPNQTGLFFLYHCNSTLIRDGNNSDLRKYEVDCFGKSDSGSTLSILEDDPSFRKAEEVCEGEVVVPVDLQKGESSNGFERMIEKGFSLDWTASNCSICENSGGKCGFDNKTYHFTCFCPDRPHAWSCPDIISENSRTRRVALKATIPIATAGIGVLIIITVFCIRRKRLSSNFRSCWRIRTQDFQSIEAFLRSHGPLALKRYEYSEVKKITGSFKFKIGQGGYGSVYKGELPDGCLVAVKVLKESKSSGEEFINEVASVSRTSHVNIVTLLGFCFEGSKQALIYEFISNGSLEKYIYKENSLKSNQQIGWGTLFEIAVGIAQGLEYLHRGCNTRILHFDIKPHNILLDENFCPKISDFGLSKICTKRESIVSMMGARGTIGYIAPEVFYRNIGGVSHKSDVYSYGMLVLEMVGARNKISAEIDHTSDVYFPDWIYKRLELDQELGLCGINNEEENQIARKLVLVSLWCIQTNPSNRPSMDRVVELLKGSPVSLEVPPRPYMSSPSRSLVPSMADSLTTTTTTG